MTNFYFTHAVAIFAKGQGNPAAAQNVRVAISKYAQVAGISFAKASKRVAAAA